VEYTPQAYVPSDIDNFAKSFDPLLSGKRPQLVSIDGGQYEIRFHFRS
jgi:tripeptidyl-peptidase-1